MNRAVYKKYWIDKFTKADFGIVKTGIGKTICMDYSILISQRISMLVICVLPLLGIPYPKYMKSLDSRWFELIIFRNSAGNYYFMQKSNIIEVK